MAEVAGGATKSNPSSKSLFRCLAAGWIEKEMDWYNGKEADPYKPIDNKRKKEVSHGHLKNACNEYERRFAFCDGLEDAKAQKSKKYSGSPYLLVATNVMSTWKAPDKDPYLSRFRFALFPMQAATMSALFITLMPGRVHGTVDGEFANMIGQYIWNNHLQGLVSSCHSGGDGDYQPDIRIDPMKRDQNPPAGIQDFDPDYGGPPSRVVVEFEIGHRNATGLREVGSVVLANYYGCFFIGIKVWKKVTNGTFGAALVVWEKTHHPGGGSTVRVRNAFDFGTKELSEVQKDCWAEPAYGSNLLPPVENWTRPIPPPPVAAPVYVIGQPPPPPAGPPNGWTLVLPKDLLFYRMFAGNAVYVPQLNIPDLSINLKQYQTAIDSILN